ncbi:MAG: hypothetical protein H6718_05335 [Polyangiaceae bacterium]|nr:hypothetical protein [Myxococcales bacterium]MCB9584796.1 hypothetical protein [Polyangiaceae bacterium]
MSAERLFVASRELRRVIAPRTTSLGLLAAITAAGFSIGCGAEFDPPSEINSLRVLAVQKDKPYPKPGDDVSVSMLWYDGSDKAPRPVQVAWFSGCYNPPGDFYYGCYESLAQSLAAVGSGQTPPPGFGVGTGNQFTFSIPDDIISSRPKSKDPDLIPYGLAYVFFAACAGELGPAPEGQGFPLACFDATGKQVASEGFVAGYTGAYVYDDFTNTNPVITGFEFNDQVVFPDCIGDACLTDPPPPSDVCGEGLACVPACEADGDPQDCPEIKLRPLISSDVAETDDVAAAAEGRNVTEQMWINYYAEKGDFKSAVRLLADAQKGFNTDYGTSFYAPKQPGDIKLWAVAHDNRGGTEWVRITVRVQ